MVDHTVLSSNHLLALPALYAEPGPRNGPVSVRLSVPSVDHCNNVRRVAAGGKAISIDCCMAGAQQQPRRSSGVQRTNVGSAALSADVGS